MRRDGQSAMSGNLPMGGYKITGLADAVAATDATTKQQMDAAIKALRDAISDTAEVDVASASTTTIGGLASNKVQITGTTTITSLGTVYKGPVFIRFAGALTLTNGAALVLPLGQNFVTKAGDLFVAWPKATGGTADGWVMAPLYPTERFTEDTGSTVLPNAMNVRTASFTLDTGLVAGEVYFFRVNHASGITVTAGAGLTLKANGSNGTLATVGWAPGIVAVYAVSSTSYVCTGAVAA